MQDTDITYIIYFFLFIGVLILLVLLRWIEKRNREKNLRKAAIERRQPTNTASISKAKLEEARKKELLKMQYSRSFADSMDKP
ncbi:MAG: hypothetical protein ACXAC7_16240 [Candidatus Hodarchaeales archaeon]